MSFFYIHGCMILCALFDLRMLVAGWVPLDVGEEKGYGITLTQCNSPRNFLHLTMTPGGIYLFHSCIYLKLSINSNNMLNTDIQKDGCSQKPKKSQIVILATEQVIIETASSSFELSVASNASLTIVEHLKTKLFSLKAQGVVLISNLDLTNQTLSISNAKSITFTNTSMEESSLTISRSHTVKFRNTTMRNGVWKEMLVKNM